MARTDSFFEDSSRKRKRSLVSGQARGGDGRPSRGTSSRGGRGRGGSSSSLNKGKGRSRRRDEDEEDAGQQVRVNGNESGLSSDESDDEQEVLLENGEDFFDSEEEEAAAETPAQKRLRLAKQYLESLKAGQETQGIDAAELERDIIAERLQKDVLEVSGRLHLRIADTLDLSSHRSTPTNTRVHRLPLTSAVMSDDCRYLFTAGKDGSIARWDASSLLSPPSLASGSQSASGAPEASTSTSAQQAKPKLVKLDFQPKRSAPSSSAKAKKRKGVSDGKGKAPIARNQPSQDVETKGHTGEVYTLALSSDGKRLASAGDDRKVGIWDVSSPEESQGCKWVSALRGHKDTIVSVKFRIGTSQIYTSSWDRTVKIYDTASLSYIETLFGHQDKIYDLAVLKNEVAVTAGGRDKTLRYWKIKDESQLVFRAGGMSKIRRVIEGGIEEDEDETEGRKSQKANGVNGQTTDEKRFIEGSADCTAMIDDQHFLSGGDSGTIALWNTGKKKAIFSIPLAHGLVEHHSATEGTVSNPRWIVSLASLPYSDIFASGSWDGSIRLWKISEDMRSFSPLSSSPSIPALGFVNSLQMLQLPASRTKSLAMAEASLINGKKAKAAPTDAVKGVMLVAALGQEHKFGRWQRIAEAKNQAIVVVIDEKRS